MSEKWDEKDRGNKNFQPKDKGTSKTQKSRSGRFQAELCRPRNTMDY